MRERIFTTQGGRKGLNRSESGAKQKQTEDLRRLKWKTWQQEASSREHSEKASMMGKRGKKKVIIEDKRYLEPTPAHTLYSLHTVSMG